MNALLVYVAFPGFACIPPADVAVRTSPYTGPFVMTVAAAQQAKTAYERSGGPLMLQLVGEDDPKFADIKSRCPPIYF